MNIYCAKCSAVLAHSARSSDYTRKTEVLVEPCSSCVQKAEDAGGEIGYGEGFTEGHKEGYQEGQEEWTE